MEENRLVAMGGGKSRIAYLDAIKCLGILLVIQGHVELMGLGLNITYDEASSLLRYSFNMPIFFFVSGFLAHKDNELGCFDVLKLKNKFLYLVLPALLIAAYYKLYTHENIIDIFTKGLGMYWFTFTLFEVFVLFYFAVMISRSKLMLIIILSLLSVAGVGYLSFFSNYEIAFLDFNHLAKYFQYFTVGVIAKMYASTYDRVMRSESIKLITTGAFFIILALLFYGILPSVAHHFIRDIVLRWLGTFVVIAWFYSNKDRFEQDTRLNKWISKIGKNSLAIYLLHYFFLPDFKAVPKLIESMDIVSVHIFSFIYAVVITVVCLIFIELLSNSAIIKKYALGKK